MEVVILMKKFIKKHKKQMIMGVICLVIILIILMTWLFILPSFNGNKYGDRLKDEKKHKISDKVISKIKDKAKDNDSVSKIEYNKEGRILNFTITVDSNFGVNQAKEFAGSIINEISKDDQKYYDIQIFIDSDEKSEQYPIIGYKSKSSDSVNYGIAGGNNG